MFVASLRFLLDLFREVSASASASDSPHRRLACLVLVAETLFYTCGSVYFIVSIVETYT